MSPAAPERAPVWVTFEAFGGLAVVGVTDPAGLAPARAAVEGVIRGFDRSCSRFRDDSELSAVNRAAGAPVKVSRLFLDAVSAAIRAAELTDGDVDPTIGEALIALGYDRDFAQVRERTQPARISVARVPGWRTVRLDAEASSVRLAPGVMLDLGATAKALAADRAAAAAAEAAGCGALASLSGDLAVAGPAPEGGWRIRVTDDHRAGVNAPGQWITLASGGLATSSTTTRRWSSEGGEAHHLIDPATGQSVQSPWRTVSVTAASCLDANTASTAAVIRGLPAEAWLEAHGLPSRLVSTDGTVSHVAGWPREGDDLPAADRLAGELA